MMQHNVFSSAIFNRVDMGIELPNGEKIVHDRVRSQALDEPFPDATQFYQARLMSATFENKQQFAKTGSSQPNIRSVKE